MSVTPPPTEASSTSNFFQQQPTTAQPNLDYQTQVSAINLVPDNAAAGGTTTHNTSGKRASRYLGTWVRQRVLGDGGFGAVFLERNRSTGVYRAVKLLRGGNTPLFHREIAVMVEVKKFPKLFVDFYCWYVDRFENVYIAMEYHQCGDLLQYVQSNGPFTEAAAKDLARQVLQGVFVLHELGISHRDIKAPNLLIGSTDPMVIKLADFGQGERLQGCHETASGTQGWAAPEAMDGNHDHSVDMWSVGCVVYYLLTALSPFGCGPVEPASERIAQFAFSFWPRLPEYQFQHREDDPHARPRRGDQILVRGISNIGNEFLNGLIVREPTRRMSAHEALGHPWVCPSTPLQVALEGGDFALAESLALHDRECRDILQGSTLREAPLVVVRVAAASGQLDLVKSALRRLPPKYEFKYKIPKCPAKPALVGAAAAGSLPIVCLLIESLGGAEVGPDIALQAFKAAIKGGHHHVVHHIWPRLSERHRAWDVQLSQHIARYGDSMILYAAYTLWTTRNRPNETLEPQVVLYNDPSSAYAFYFPTLVECAARHGNAERVRWFWTMRPSPNTPIPDGALRGAIEAGHYDTVAFLLESYSLEPKPSSAPNALFITALADASFYGHMHIVRRLAELGVIPSVHAINQAVRANKTDVFRFLIDRLLHGAKMHPRLVAGYITPAAVPHCDARLLNWLCANRADRTFPGLSGEHVRHAARLGASSTVSWFIANAPDLPMRDHLVSEAIIGASELGHLDMVVSLCITPARAGIVEAWEGAANGGHIPVLEHLVLHNPEPHIATLRRALRAAVHGNCLGTVLWLLCRGADAVNTDGRISTFVCQPVIQRLLNDFGYGL